MGNPAVRGSRPSPSAVALSEPVAPRPGRARSSPSTTNSTGPATSTSRAAALSWIAAWAAWRAVTGTGRPPPLGTFQLPGVAGAGEGEQGGTPVPAGHEYGGHVAGLVVGQPLSSYSTSPSIATTGTSTRVSWSTASTSWRRGRLVGAGAGRTPPARRQSRVDGSDVAGEAGIRDGAHRPILPNRLRWSVGWTHALSRRGHHRQHHLGRARAGADRHRWRAELGRMAAPRPRRRCPRAGLDAGADRRLADRHPEAGGNILEDVINWAARLVFSPPCGSGSSSPGPPPDCSWLSGLMRPAGIGVRGRPGDIRAGRTSGGPGPSPEAAARKRDDDLDDMADIEAILKKHGI